MKVDKQKKTGGRVKGTPNKLDANARKLFIETLEGLSPNIQKAFLDVLNGVEDEEGNIIIKPNPEKFLDLFSKYAQYFVPKKTALDVEGGLDLTGINIKEIFGK